MSADHDAEFMSHVATAERIFLRQHFDELHTLLSVKFDIDCCSPSKSTALAPTYTSDFLATDVSGKCCWINAPPAQMKAFVRHCLACKQKDPSTSACFVVPAWRRAPWLKHFSAMRLVRQYAKGSKLYAEHIDGECRSLPGNPWAVNVF